MKANAAVLFNYGLSAGPRVRAFLLHVQHNLQIAACRLFAFNGFKECLEVAFAETAAAFALDDLVEERRAVLYGTSENLQHVAFVVAINENTEFFEFPDRLVDLADTPFELCVVCVRDFEELDALLLQFGNGEQDVVRG